MSRTARGAPSYQRQKMRQIRERLFAVGASDRSRVIRSSSTATGSPTVIRGMGTISVQPTQARAPSPDRELDDSDLSLNASPSPAQSPPSGKRLERAATDVSLSLSPLSD